MIFLFNRFFCSQKKFQELEIANIAYKTRIKIHNQLESNRYKAKVLALSTNDGKYSIHSTLSHSYVLTLSNLFSSLTYLFVSTIFVLAQFPNFFSSKFAKKKLNQLHWIRRSSVTYSAMFHLRFLSCFKSIVLSIFVVARRAFCCFSRKRKPSYSECEVLTSVNVEQSSYPTNRRSNEVRPSDCGI